MNEEQFLAALRKILSQYEGYDLRGPDRHGDIVLRKRNSIGPQGNKGVHDELTEPPLHA